MLDIMVVNSNLLAFLTMVFHFCLNGSDWQSRLAKQSDIK